VTRLAYAQVQSYGMSDKIGQMSFPTREEQAEYGMVGTQPYSKNLKRIIDEVSFISDNSIGD
jgi:ATP-dependent Zn protease